MNTLGYYNNLSMFNNLGYGSGISGLFQGVYGLDTYSSGSLFGNGYGSYYGGSCCNSSGKSTDFNWSTFGWILGTVGVGVLGLIGKGIWNNHQTKKADEKAAAEKETAEFNKALENLGLGGRSVESLTESEINSATVDESKVPNITTLNSNITTAQNTLTSATEAYDDAAALAATLQSLETAYNTANSEYEAAVDELNAMSKDTTVNQAQVDAKNAAIKLLETKKTEAEKELEKAKTAEKDIAEPNGKLYKAKDQADKNLKTATKAKEAAKETLRTESSKTAIAYIQAYQKRQLESALDKADGTAASRMGKKHYSVNDDGTYKPNDGQEITKSDVCKLLKEYSSADAGQKQKIKAFVQKYADKIDAKSLSESERTSFAREFGLKYDATAKKFKPVNN